MIQNGGRSANTVSVSVCIPCYNTEKFIPQTIESVLSQTFADFELVVVDNRSTDRTVEVVGQFKDPRIVLKQNDSNIGAVNNYNRCLSLAQGKYIKILPADDTLYPTCLEKQVAVLDRAGNEDVAFVYCSRDVINARGRYVMKAKFPGVGRIPRDRMIRRNIHHGMNIIGEPGAVLFRAEAARKAGGFDGSLPYIVDLDYWIRLMEHGDAFSLPETLCTFRLSGENWSFALGRQRKENYLAFIEKMFAGNPALVSRLDVCLGKARVHLNEVLRKWVYRFLLR